MPQPRAVHCGLHSVNACAQWECSCCVCPSCRLPLLACNSCKCTSSTLASRSRAVKLRRIPADDSASRQLTVQRCSFALSRSTASSEGNCVKEHFFLSLSTKPNVLQQQRLLLGFYWSSLRDERAPRYYPYMPCIMQLSS